jgi:hypothetical protein
MLLLIWFGYGPHSESVLTAEVPSASTLKDNRLIEICRPGSR